jgi:hypothetical protein
MNFFNIEQRAGRFLAIRIADQDFQRFHLQFSHFENTPYVIWLGCSTEEYPRVVFKIHAPFCRSLSKAIKKREMLWRYWNSGARIWEIEYDSPHWTEIVESIKNDTVQSLFEHILYYLDEEMLRMELDRTYAEIQKDFITTRHLYPNNIVYGQKLTEFKNGLIHIRPNYRPDKQYLRIEIYAHKRFIGCFKDVLKGFGYEPLHYHYDPVFKAWSFTISNPQLAQSLINGNKNPETAWINTGLERIIDWFRNFKIEKINLFNSYSSKLVEDELIECCRIETETGSFFFI